MIKGLVVAVLKVLLNAAEALFLFICGGVLFFFVFSAGDTLAVLGLSRFPYDSAIVSGSLVLLMGVVYWLIFMRVPK